MTCIFEENEKGFSVKVLFIKNSVIIEPMHEKNNNLGFRPGLIQTSLYSHSRRLEA